MATELRAEPTITEAHPLVGLHPANVAAQRFNDAHAVLAENPETVLLDIRTKAAEVGVCRIQRGGPEPYQYIRGLCQSGYIDQRGLQYLRSTGLG